MKLETTVSSLYENERIVEFEDIEKDKIYSQSINFDNDFKRFVNDFVNSFDISEMILKSITVQSLLDK